ncbi:hypothetical protein AX16_000840 [Volvariella volvacea WC 439]|nr:hypothetical protein AX16_000840 [Volvariella volvacea WC 439]
MNVSLAIRLLEARICAYFSVRAFIRQRVASTYKCMATVKRYDFVLDETPTGIVNVDAAPGYPDAQYDAQLVKATDDGTDVVDSFVMFTLAKDPYPYYMKLDDYKLRVKGDKAIYLADWASYDNKGRLTCDMWDKDGRLMNQGSGVKTGAVPSSMVAQLRRSDSSVKTRLRSQTEIWQNIAREQAASTRSSGRLWKSHVPLSPPLQLYIFANDTEFIPKENLQDSTKDINMTELNTWLTLQFRNKNELATEKKKTPDLCCLSTNILGMYDSYMTKGDIQRLVAAQTAGKKNLKDWMRTFLTQTQAEGFHDAMVKSTLYDPSTKIAQTSTTLTGKRPSVARVNAGDIMGESANAWANKFWPGDDDTSSMAEWLHRSAFGFGPINGANWQSAANIIFGTYQSNGHMTRAESLITSVIRSILPLFPNTGSGTLYTRIVNNGDYEVLNAQGQKEKYTIPAWVSDKTHSYSWLSPELTYSGSFKADKDNYPYNTRFHTFNCYTPLSIEGQLDRRAWKAFFKTKYGHLMTSGKKPRTDARLAVSKNSASSPSTTLSSTPHYSTIPFHRDAWLSQRHDGTARVPSDGAGKTPESGDPTTAPPDGGFTLVGDITLFGVKELTATLKSWHGPPPPDIEIGNDLPICQQAEIDSLPVLAFLPWVAGTPLEKAHLSAVTLTYQNYAFEPLKPIGWSISANLVIDEQFGELNQILSQVLQIPQDSLTIQVTASIGLNQDWSSLPSISNFVLEGLIFVKDPVTNTYKSILLYKGVSLSRIGVRLSSFSATVPGTAGETTTSYGFALFGELDLELPSSRNPLLFDFEISEFAGSAQLNATLKGDIWENALGSGFDLETVTFSASFGLSSPLSSLHLSLSAILDAETTVAELTGSYTIAGELTLSAEIKDFSCDGIIDLYTKFSGEEVTAPKDEEFVVGSALITFSSSTGLSMTVSDVKYGDYASANASLQFSSSGVALSAELENIDFSEYGFKLVDVTLNASFLKMGSSKASNVELDVTVQLDGVEDLPKIKGVVHVYKQQEDTQLQWTIYGEFEGFGKATRLGSLISVLDGTFVGDLGLNDLALVVASKDEPSLSTMNPMKFPIKRGVQVCAVIDKIDQVEKLLRHSSPGLILAAAWSSSSGFSLDIQFPTNGIIHLGHGVTTDPMQLQISMNPIRLMFSGGVKVPVPSSSTPLDFKLALSVQNEEVYASGQMTGLWNNPFGISPQVTIGPNLALELGIILPQFFATGTPSSFGFAGGLSIGKVRGDVAVQINEDPTQELLSGNLENLGILDLVAFTSTVLNTELPNPPDFIDFKKLSLYMSTGVTIGTIFYPQGFSFQADIQVFNSEFQVSAAITKSALTTKGDIKNLRVGPLSVGGRSGQDATFDLEVGPSKQHISVDGAITLLGSEVALLLNLELLPNPAFYFDLLLNLTPLLTFSVNAQMKGSVNLKELSKLEFLLHALMEQHIIDYVVAQVIDTLEAAKRSADETIEEDEEKVEEAKAIWKKAVEDAQKDLDDKYESWKKKEKEVYDKSNKVIADYEKMVEELEGDIDQAGKDFNQSVRDAEVRLLEANADRAAKMQKAEGDVTKAKSDWDSDIKAKEQDLENAKANLNRAFANAERDINNAKSRVNSLQREINDIKKEIKDYEHAHWYEFWKKAAIPGLYVGLGSVEASKAIADGVLDACKAVLEGADYIAVKGAVTEALQAVKESGDGLLNAAKETLEAVDEATQAVIDAAEQGLEDVRIAGKEAVRLAEKALDDFKEASIEALQAARDAIDALVQAAEWLAYQTAMAALDAAKHGTAALDVAIAALEAAKATTDGILDIAEDFFKALAEAFNITKIEITADLAAFAGNSSFNATVQGTIMGEAFEVGLALDLTDTSKFIHGLYSHVVKKAPKKPSPPTPPLPPIPPTPPPETTDPSGLYIPPQGIHFRLLGTVSQLAIFSRTNASPPVGASSSKSNDQYFTFIHGTDQRQGLYAIKSRQTGLVLFSQAAQQPTTGHVAGDGQLANNWFKLERGQGKLGNSFRLITLSNNLALFSRSQSSPNFGAIKADQRSDDQYFTFDWEDLETISLGYDFGQAKIVFSESITLDQQTLVNDTSEPKQMQYVLNKLVTHTSNFEYSRGLLLWTGFTVTGGIPSVTDSGGFQIDRSSGLMWRVGPSDSFSKPYTQSISIRVSPQYPVRFIARVTKGTVEVPYTILLKSKSTGAVTTSRGMWAGILSWGFRMQSIM